MSRVVWKFPLLVGKMNALEVPAASTVVLAAVDPASGAPAIWLELDADDPRVKRRFRIYGTGHVIAGGDDRNGDGDRHVGSMIDRTYVWHVYEVML